MQGRNGGSGGGGRYTGSSNYGETGTTGGQPVVAQGYKGGDAFYTSGAPYGGGGGGGASAAGANSTSGGTGGAGGNGLAVSITGSSVTYAGGGLSLIHI